MTERVPLPLNRKSGNFWLTLTGLLLAASMLPAGGMASCNPTNCTPTSPGYNPVTGQCTTQGDTGVIYPGAGGLPAEPGTPTPTMQPAPGLDPNSVDLNIFGLGGRWLDNGREVCVNHGGSGVYATYYAAYSCDHDDDTNQVTTTYTDFDAQLSSKTLTGTTSVCSHGHDDVSANGIKDIPMTMTVSDDGKSMNGTWHNNDTNSDVPIILTRKTVGDCHAP